MKPFLLGLLILFLSSFSEPLVEVAENSCTKIEKTFSISKAINEIQSTKIKDSTYLACLHHQVGVEYYLIDEYILALQHYEKAIKIREEINDALLYRTHYNIALTYHELNNYSKAIFHNQLAYNIYGFKRPVDSINILLSLSLDYAAVGDIEQALQYGKMAIKKRADTIFIVKAFNALANNLITTNDISKAEQAILYLEKAQKLKNRDNVSSEVWNFININKGFAYGILNQNDKAIEQYNLVLNSLSKEDTIARTYTLNNMGVELMDQKKYTLALGKFDQSLKLKQTYFWGEKFEFEYAANHENIADCYFKMNNFKVALQNYQLAIINLTNSFRSTDILQNPVLSENLYVYSNIDLIRVLDAKAKTAFAFYMHNKDVSYLQLAHQTYKTLFDFHNQLQQEISTENSRLFQAKNLLPYIENALNVVYRLQDKDIAITKPAFQLMEKNKATVLLQSINESQALKYANIPGTVLEQEGALKTAIGFYKKQLNDAKVFEEQENINRFEKLLFEEENSYNQLIAEIENNYPNYYQLKYQQNQIQLKDVQNYIDKDAMTLEYFIGDSSVYVLSIQKDKSKLYKTQKPKNWEELINNFRQSVTDMDLIQNSEQEAYNLFTKSAFELYTILLQKPLNDIEPNIKYLKIIPDAELNYTPFDILLTKAPKPGQINYANLAYLLKEKTISYAYSVALLLENNQAQIQYPKIDSLDLYAGFAPVYTTGKMVYNKTSQQNDITLRSENIIDLPNARKSVQKIAGLLSGQSFLGAEASKQKFISKASKFKILHLAMHGFLNDENPLYSNLLFTQTADSTDNLLHAADLYNLELNADLVVLSACNTGAGKLQKGEGVMSLSRAFTYAGSNSLVMSLWEIPDKATSTIMQNFFLNLKNGNKKDIALQTAKLDFMHNYPERANPLFWAGFVSSGNMSAIDFEGNHINWWIYVLITLAVLLFIGVARLFFKKGNK